MHKCKMEATQCVSPILILYQDSSFFVDDTPGLGFQGSWFSVTSFLQSHHC